MSTREHARPFDPQPLLRIIDEQPRPRLRRAPTPMPASSLPPSRELWERAQRVRGEAAIACIRSWKLHLLASRLCKQGVFERPWAR